MDEKREKMSERGSFVTEYIYCKKCFKAAQKALLGKRKYLCSSAIPTYQDESSGSLPIIAGKVGGLGPRDEFLYFELELLPLLSELICHEMRVTILADCGQATLLVSPGGESWKAIHKSIFRYTGSGEDREWTDETAMCENIWDE